MQINIGLFSLLGLIFVVLKLTDVIAWSWWLVLLPFYGGLALIAIVFLFFLVLALIFGSAR